MEFLSYLFWPNPGNATYQSPKAIALLIACVVLAIFSVGIRLWRRNLQNPVTKKLSASWGSAAFWFGLSGAVMVVARVEQIQFLAMRFLWVLWAAFACLYLFFQLRRFRQKHYEVLPKVKLAEDPREKYLPTKKKH